MMIKVQILSPEWSRELEATAVFLPGAMGEFEVLPSHAPIISTLSAGKMRWRDASGAEESLAVRGGIVRLKDNVMQVCVEE